jgi:hypothetical protein
LELVLRKLYIDWRRHPRSQYALQIDTERIRFDRREPPATNKWHHSEVRDW